MMRSQLRRRRRKEARSKLLKERKKLILRRREKVVRSLNKRTILPQQGMILNLQLRRRKNLHLLSNLPKVTGA